MGNIQLGLALGSVGALLYFLRPKDPVFQVMSIHLKGFKLRFCTISGLPAAVIDVELTVDIKVTNPNAAPIEYKSTVMDIYYSDSLLAQAQVPAGRQGANSCEVLEVPAKMDGLQVTQHLKELMGDIAAREMNLTAVVTINGSAWLWKWGHAFQIQVHAQIKVDPLLLDVIEQENKVHLQL